MQNLSIEGFRLSPQQKRLWQMQQVDSDQSYCACCSILIEGNCQPEILKEALKKSIGRNEILHTDFQALQGMAVPLQVIIDEGVALITDYDFSELNLEEQDTKLHLLFQEKRKKNFDFGQGKLLVDASLVSLSPNRRMLILCLPALCADRVTFSNLVLEISHDYAVSLCKQESVDEQQPLQYADLAEWQNELFEGEEAELGRGYWQKKQGTIPLSDFQFCFENLTALESPKPNFKADFFSLVFPTDYIAKLKEIALRQNVSVSVLLQACWQILLWRSSGKSDIVVGTCCDGRSYDELKSALGLLSKFLPVYCHFEGKSKFSEILRQIGEAVEESFKWQESFSWEQVVELSDNALELDFFPICFEFEDRLPKCSIADISLSIDKQYVCFDQFKLKLLCVRSDDTFLAEFHYDSNLFQVDVIERLARQFRKLLDSVIENSEIAIGELEILSDRDRRQLLVEFNQTQANYPQDRCIHHLFEEQARNKPNQVAIVFEDQQLTYAELNDRANQLAHYLQKLEVGPEILVGLYVERSLEFIVGLLGTLKAGGAYLPLDPALPKEGVAFRLQDAQVSVLLSQHQLVETIPESETQLICLDSQWEVIAQESKENPTSEAKVESLAYVLFTSGSTGNPKGVAVEHQQLLNYISAITEQLDLSICSGFATVSTFAADLGNTAIFPSLCNGGCLHVISQERASNPEALADYFRRHPIDCLKIVPSHLTALLTHSQPEQLLPRLRLILGGEACSWKLIEQIQSYTPDCLIFNHYGPTETTVGALTYPVRERILHVTLRGESVPIGRPISNTQIYLLDSYLQPVPLGVPGELYIGGDGLARGYFNRPELTQERFIVNPFSNTKSQRLYKTGDLARYLLDGNIEFLGRIDHQVKVRGFRIELGEIECTLKRYSTVREAVVLAREDQPGNKRLVAYVVTEDQADLATNDLRRFLLEKLPEYMVPAAFVTLEALPLTPNGKIDRQALPAPKITHSFVAPSTDAEKALADIWAQILRLEKVGIHDNFFELGGDSILSIQIVARANQAGLKLTPKQVFEHQTIAELATVAATGQVIQAQQGLVTGQVALTPIQHWFFEQNLPEAHHWNQSILLEVRQALDPQLLQQTMQSLLEHHDALRLRFAPQEASWQQWESHADEPTPFTLLDLSTVSEAEQSLVISTAATDLQASLNLSAGPLMRVVYFDFGTTRPARLLWVIHHLAVDGVSWRILLEDFQRVYEQLTQGQEIQLPPKTTSFQRWAERLQEYGRSEVAQQELDYWLSQSRQPVNPIPVDFPGGENTVASASVVSTALSQADTQALLQEVPKAYQTRINDVLLTALAQALAEWTGNRSLLVDLEGHGREDLFEDVDLSRTVGWFTTLFPVVLNIEDLTNSGEALKTIKEQIRSIPKRGIGYGVLRHLNQEAAEVWQHQSQVEVRFNYLGQTDQSFQESSLCIPAQEPIGTGRSLQSNRSHLLDISGIVAGGQLRLNWTYSETIHRRATIETLADEGMAALRSLIAHCQSPEAGGHTPSDFQKANVTQKDLDKLLAKINRGS